ncbi:MAG: carbohydrate kinase family protein [Phycisphaerales bacterium]|nr:carbohydrate kinase family protein [Phycisphaerales bacterium]
MRSIVIIGIATVDALGRPVDDFPRPGGLRFFDELTLATGGCAVNCAIALSRLGVPCRLVTRVGGDILGDFVVAELTRNGVATGGVIRDNSVNTSFSFAAVRSDGERAFLHTTGANARIRPADLPADALEGGPLVFVAGSMLMDALDGPPTGALLAAARAAGATTLLDTVYVDSAPQAEWERRIGPALPHLDYFLPSLPEARALSGLTEPAEIARQFRSRGTKNVIIKLGAEGVYCLSATGAEFRIPAEPVERVVDATGAGDCWSAGFLAGLAAGLPLERALRAGNAVAACGIQSVGATSGVRPIPGLLA